MKSKLAVQKIVPYKGLSPRTQNAAAVLHTNGFDPGNGSLFAGFTKNATGGNGPDMLHVGAHFQVMVDGTIEQYADTDFQLGHAFDANTFAVGIETEDKGKCETAWTQAQIDSIIALLLELGCPPVLLKETASDGVGFHRQFPSWNKNNHSCPCNTREDQITEDILPGMEDNVSFESGYSIGFDLYNPADPKAQPSRPSKTDDKEGWAAYPLGQLVRAWVEAGRPIPWGAGGTAPTYIIPETELVPKP